MQNIVLKLKGVKVLKYDSKDNSFKISIDFLEDDKPKQLLKTFSLDESAVLLTKDILTEIKKQTKVMHGIDGNDPFGNYGHVYYNEKEEGEAEEKLLGALNRLRDRAREFKRLKSADDYINRVHEMNSLKIEFR